MSFIASLWIFVIAASLQQAQSNVELVVTGDRGPIARAQVVVSGRTSETNVDGRVVLLVPPGEVQITVIKEGFNPVTISVTATAAAQVVPVTLEPQETLEAHVTVSATRTGKRLEDQPMRVEVLDAEEIAEKQLMTPGDIVMMLNEMGGLRVQATSPSLGAASVRVQGMRGRYTRFLSDGLPLFGTDVGGLGLLQIPPSDLGQVEVIKGVASALYGAGALGGVVDLIARRPGAEAARDILVNRTSRGGTDAVLFAAQPLTDRWSGTLLAGGHWQQRTDVDGDGWADLAGYSRGVLRPRLFWNDGSGRSLFATAGAMWEQRDGGTMPSAVLPATGAPFLESLDTSRFDGGLVAQRPVRERQVLTFRLSATHKTEQHHAGEDAEHDVQSTLFAELALRGTAARQTWVVGAAFERSAFDPRDHPQFAYTFNVPGVFVQDDIDVTPWLALSASARVDVHNEFGTFVSPRVSALLRRGGWTSRVSAGSGFFAPTALTEETEAAGLSRLTIEAPLKAEGGRSASVDVTRTIGPLTITGTLFHYHVADPAVVDRATYTLATLSEPTTTAGIESVATYRRAPFSVTGTYTFVRSREGVGAERGEVPLTPQHSAGLVGMWEDEGWGRAGVEAYFTGRQRLEDNPYRTESEAYVLFGGLVERRLGRIRLFVNAENLGNVRQTRRDPLLRPTRAVDGRWTVDAWAPLDGRVINGGIRVGF
ncbi:MAG TPA: TonB-dependent receptor [Vicinamibacterales bacterium]|nr:TonB-dependent receptor [Vicinamibacterales bacterium]